jgi:hypothetical protein
MQGRGSALVSKVRAVWGTAMNEVKKVIPNKWDKLDDVAKLSMRLSQPSLPPENRRYMVVNLHDYVAQLFGMSKIGVLDLNFNRRRLEMLVESYCKKNRWADRVKALRYLNDAWEHVRDSKEPRMYLRKNQDNEEPKRLIDEYLARCE